MSEWCTIESDPGVLLLNHVGESSLLIHTRCLGFTMLGVFTEMIAEFGVKGVQVDELFTLDTQQFEDMALDHCQINFHHLVPSMASYSCSSGGRSVWTAVNVCRPPPRYTSHNKYALTSSPSREGYPQCVRDPSYYFSFDERPIHRPRRNSSNVQVHHGELHT